MSGTGVSRRGGARLLIAAMTLANAMVLVDQTAVPVSLPDIMKTFDVGSQTALPQRVPEPPARHRRGQPDPGPDPARGAELKAQLQAAEATGLRPKQFDPALLEYLRPARSASDHGYAVAFIAVAIIAALGMAAVAWLVRPPPTVVDESLVEAGARPVAAESA